MISIITTIILVLVLFLLGNVIPALKKLFGLLTKLFLKILSFFGIKIKTREQGLRVSDEFKNTYEEIKIVKLSNKNTKQLSSINWTSFTILVIAGLLFLINMFTNNAISNGLFNLIKNFKFIKTAEDMKVMYTATLFSAMSFALSGLMNRWKLTKQQRLENKQNKLKRAAIKLMSTKELLDEAKLKDEEKYKELK